MVKHYSHLYSFVLAKDASVPSELCNVILKIINLLLHTIGCVLHLHHLCMHHTQASLGKTKSCFKYFSNLTYGLHSSFMNRIKECCSRYSRDEKVLTRSLW